MGTLPNHSVRDLQRVQKEFLQGTTNPKIKHDTLCISYKQSDLKNTDVPNKIASLQCSRRYNNERKLISLQLITKSFWKFCKFHLKLMGPLNVGRL